MNKSKSIFILWEGALKNIYGTQERAEIEALTDLCPVCLDQDSWQDAKELLQEVECVMSGWGMAIMDEAFLEAAPNLKHVFYGAGSVRGFYKQAAMERGIGISSAWRANAIPVAEFAHAAILLSLKKVWRCNRMLEESRVWEKSIVVPGGFRSTVGLLSLGAIGRHVAQRLQSHDLNVLAYDPYSSPAEADALGVRLVDLEELFALSDVVSVHTPLLPQTHGIVNSGLLSSMKHNASLINTSRGEIIDEDALVAVLRARPDLDALLDVVTDEQTISTDSPLWGLPNAFLTPHIAGSMDSECQRMGQYMVSELKRYLSGEPMQYAVTPQMLEINA